MISFLLKNSINPYEIEKNKIENTIIEINKPIWDIGFVSSSNLDIKISLRNKIENKIE